MPSNIKLCSRCKDYFVPFGYASMSADGVSLNSCGIVVYEKTYNLCPKCTAQLYVFLNKPIST